MDGQRVGSYEIVRTLARGGMAIVYLARQPALDRVVALKQVDFESDDPTLARRFVGEARLAAALDHPNVVTLFDFFVEDGVPYMAMEYVAGGSLRPLVGKLRPVQIFGVLEGILAGLGHAEDHGVAHRDLKPENVLIARRGVKIADFGIARAYDALTHSFTASGATVGTPAYMAPEQALDERLGPYTDLYAVGVIAYELLAGRPPFDPRNTPVSILFSHVHRQPPPLREQAPDAPLPVCRWVESLLAKAPGERPQSAAVAWEALEEIVVGDLGPYWRRAAAIPAPERDEEPEAATRRLRTMPQPPTTSPLTSLVAASRAAPQAPLARRSRARHGGGRGGLGRRLHATSRPQPPRSRRPRRSTSTAMAAASWWSACRARERAAAGWWRSTEPSAWGASAAGAGIPAASEPRRRARTSTVTAGPTSPSAPPPAAPWTSTTGRPPACATT